MDLPLLDSEITSVPRGPFGCQAPFFTSQPKKEDICHHSSRLSLNQGWVTDALDGKNWILVIRC